MKNRFTVLVLIVFALVGLSCQLTQAAPPEPTTAPLPTQPPAATAAVQPTQPPAAETPQPQIVTQMYTNEEPPRYGISLEYPVLQGVDSAAAENFQAIVQGQMDALLSEFQTGLDMGPIITPDASAPSPQNFLTSKYEVLYNAHGLVSIHAENSNYFYGAAHPNPFSSVINYSLPLQRELALADLFQPGTAYLQRIADYCMNQLRQDEWFTFAEGAQPVEENYRKWNITSEGLRITYDPYQVAAYAAGYVRVTVPWSELTDLIDPAGPLAGVVE